MWHKIFIFEQHLFSLKCLCWSRTPADPSPRSNIPKMSGVYKLNTQLGNCITQCLKGRSFSGNLVTVFFSVKYGDVKCNDAFHYQSRSPGKNRWVWQIKSVITDTSFHIIAAKMKGRVRWEFSVLEIRWGFVFWTCIQIQTTVGIVWEIQTSGGARK